MLLICNCNRPSACRPSGDCAFGACATRDPVVSAFVRRTGGANASALRADLKKTPSASVAFGDYGFAATRLAIVANSQVRRFAPHVLASLALPA